MGSYSINFVKPDTSAENDKFFTARIRAFDNSANSFFIKMLFRRFSSRGSLTVK